VQDVVADSAPPQYGDKGCRSPARRNGVRRPGPVEDGLKMLLS